MAGSGLSSDQRRFWESVLREIDARDFFEDDGPPVAVHPGDLRRADRVELPPGAAGRRPRRSFHTRGFPRALTSVLFVLLALASLAIAALNLYVVLH